MFKYIDGGTAAAPLRLTLDGKEVEAREGEMVAMTLLRSGVSRFRASPVSGAPRAPLCMMGVCFECLVTIDGRKQIQSCITPVVQGMDIRTNRVVEAAETDE